MISTRRLVSSGSALASVRPGQDAVRAAEVGVLGAAPAPALPVFVQGAARALLAVGRGPPGFVGLLHHTLHAPGFRPALSRAGTIGGRVERSKARTTPAARGKFRPSAKAVRRLPDRARSLRFPGQGTETTDGRTGAPRPRPARWPRRPVPVSRSGCESPAVPLGQQPVRTPARIQCRGRARTSRKRTRAPRPGAHRPRAGCCRTDTQTESQEPHPGRQRTHDRFPIPRDTPPRPRRARAGGGRGPRHVPVGAVLREEQGPVRDLRLPGAPHRELRRLLLPLGAGRHPRRRPHGGALVLAALPHPRPPLREQAAAGAVRQPPRVPADGHHRRRDRRGDRRVHGGASSGAW